MSRLKQIATAATAYTVFWTVIIGGLSVLVWLIVNFFIGVIAGEPAAMSALSQLIFFGIVAVIAGVLYGSYRLIRWSFKYVTEGKR